MNDKNLQGSKTEQNLINAFAGESQARNKYTFYAKQAKKEGYEQISAIFLETAENEKEHAKLFFEHIGNIITGNVNGNYGFTIGTTEENLKNAAKGENEEWSCLYEHNAQIAFEEGFTDIGNTFKHVIEAEKHHEQRYLKLLKSLSEQTLFKKDYEAEWICRKCGFVLKGNVAPEKCPNCHHPKGYFQLLCEEY